MALISVLYFSRALTFAGQISRASGSSGLIYYQLVCINRGFLPGTKTCRRGNTDMGDTGKNGDRRRPDGTAVFALLALAWWAALLSTAVSLLG